MVHLRRGLLKYILLIPTLWFITILTFSFRTDSSQLSRSHDDLPINVVNQIVTAPSFVDRIINILPFKQQNIDHDHPPEERIKAIRQARQMNAQVQVIAPEVDHHRNLSGPGEMGNAVLIKKDKLSEDERKKYDDGWKNNAFNQYVSDMISLRRSLADVRDPE
jgi:hypothetical protein